MNRFRTSLVLSLLVLAGCGGNADIAGLRAIEEVPRDGLGGTKGVSFGGAGGFTSIPDAGGDQGGAGGSDTTNTGGSDQGGAGGSDVGGHGGDSDPYGSGGSGAGSQGGAASWGGSGGSDVGQGGSDQGGSDQGGTGGTDPGTGGDGGADGSPSCAGIHLTCDGLLFRECNDGEYDDSTCEFNCEDGRGCFGECANGDTQCSGNDAQTCVDGVWTTFVSCPFQCVNAACEGACTPGTVVCDGLSTVTCGADFHYGSPAACPTDPNGTTTCNDGICDLQPIPCSPGMVDCDGNWSCESDFTSLATCGSCDTACDPDPQNASPTCTASGCGFVCDAGFEDCDGNPANGCEQNIADDALNCGACGKSCYGTTCEAGQCEYDFEVVSDYSGENTRVHDLTVAATHVYWLTATELRRAPKAGGDYEVLATLTGQSSALLGKTGVLVHAGKVAWVVQDGVYVMPENGGTPKRIFHTSDATKGVRGLAAANGKLYWNDSQFENNGSCNQTTVPSTESGLLHCNNSHITTFRSYDLTAGTTTTFQLSGIEHSTPLGVVGDEVYVATFDASWWPRKYNIQLIAYSISTGTYLRQFGGAVTVNGEPQYAVNGFYGAVLLPGTMVHCMLIPGKVGIITAPPSEPKPLQTNKWVTTIEGLGLLELVADSTTAYYSQGDRSKIEAVTLTGQALAPIFENDKRLQFPQLGLDESYIYFTAYTDDGEQAILRAPK